MNHLNLLEVASDVARKGAEMAEKDPHGFTITLVSVTVVFAALIILYFAYKLVGILVSRNLTAPTAQGSAAGNIDEETAAAISMALHEHLDANVHDKESYRITIRRK